jgi:hypothetical protein
MEPLPYDIGRDSGYNCRVFLRSKQYHYLFDPAMKRTSVNLKQRCKIIFEGQDFTGLALDKLAPPSLMTSGFLQRYPEINFVREFEVECPFDGDPLLDK